MKTILCPTDFSECAQAGLLYARELALRTKAQLFLLHVIPKHSARIAKVDHELVKEAKLKLAHQKEQLVEQGLPASAISTEIVHQFPLDVVVSEFAKTERANLIVMGTAGANGLQEIILSSTAAEVIEEASCPVLVVPVGTTFRPFQKIVLATDLEGKLPKDLKMVVELADLFKAEITFLHILTKKGEQNSEEVQKGFNRIKQELSYDNLAFQTIQTNNVEEGITDFIKKTDADLLVMMNSPHTFWEIFFGKSLTKNLAYQIRIPLLALHS